MDEAFGLIETVEKAAMLYMIATASGKRINTITDENLWAIVERFSLQDVCKKEFLDL
jgi:ribulose-5-phosphate 4-epimerase/fuculose-1-phosphate aldolase